MKEKLLSDWENRTRPKWGGDKVAGMRQEIEMLNALQNCGCDITRDGLSVKMQLNERREMVREIMRLQHCGI
jgi:hypothetical protein